MWPGIVHRAPPPPHPRAWLPEVPKVAALPRRSRFCSGWGGVFWDILRLGQALTRHPLPSPQQLCCSKGVCSWTSANLPSPPLSWCEKPLLRPSPHSLASGGEGFPVGSCGMCFCAGLACGERPLPGQGQVSLCRVLSPTAQQGRAPLAPAGQRAAPSSAPPKPCSTQGSLGAPAWKPALDGEPVPPSRGLVQAVGCGCLACLMGLEPGPPLRPLTPFLRSPPEAPSSVPGQDVPWLLAGDSREELTAERLQKCATSGMGAAAAALS